ncbi:hypothetical protein FRC12_018707 [Ceratobasidium sp. 428]|nr:hypothetical protein FRC12_018707 [Ceratobasidium sp. 428]
MLSPQDLEDNASNLHPLQVPELFRIVCSFLDAKGLSKLLYLSRDIYNSVLPILWQDVDMKFLFHLIPGTKTKESNPNNPKGCNYVITFPSRRDLARFAVHAPLVKTLRTSRPYAVHFPSEWPRSGPDATIIPLLPNLQRLVITTFASGSVKGALVDWIPRLLYPGLLRLEMFTINPIEEPDFEEYSWLNKDTYLDLLNEVSRICPHIETLRLFPRGLNRPDEYYCTKVFNYIAGLQRLRSLAFSGAMVHKELFKTLSQLPHLETLSLCTDYMGDIDEYDESSLGIPNNSFPSLKHLYLQGLHVTTISRVCKVPTLFCHLKKAIIRFDDDWYDTDDDEVTCSNVAVTSLGQNAPYIQELTVLTRGNFGSFVVSWSILGRFKYMPLRSLRLGELAFDIKDEEADSNNGSDYGATHNQRNYPEIKWEDFLDSVPQLEELQLERQRIDSQTLQLIAIRLFNLRLLVFGDLYLSEAEPPSGIGHTTTQPITLRGHTYLDCQNSKIPPDEEAIYKVARCIFGIWPNVVACEKHTTPNIDMGRARSEFDKSTAARIYAAVQSLKISK